MTSKELLTTSDHRPVCVGSGLVTLDIVFDADSPDEYVVGSGGSCGNVMSILSYLGWKAYPVTRLGLDPAARIVLDDLVRFGVCTEFISQEETVDTPSIIEGLRYLRSGRRAHSYTLRCPNCGNYLLRYRAISAEMTDQVINSVEDNRVFYFDRVSRGILNLADHYRKRGALIVFEPSGIRNEKFFREAIALSHILKYSHERIPDTPVVSRECLVPLEIQTLGPEGLRYRHSNEHETNVSWHYIPAFQVSDVVDEAGAGDWCTSGIIQVLGQCGADSFRVATDIEIVRALKHGQALAAVTCQYISPRGAMYALSPEQLCEIVRELTTEKVPRIKTEIPLYGTLQELVKSICARCSRPELRLQSV